MVIAEAGVNHNGDLGLAMEMVRVAKSCGADCIKLQTFCADDLVTSTGPKAAYQIKSTGPSESQLEMLRKLELRHEEFADLISVCRDEEILFMSTPYGFRDVELLADLGVEAYKVASAMLVEPEFLRRIALKGKPMILSTGMANLAEIDEAVRTVRETGNDQIVLLQCTTDYPAMVADANLRAMKGLARTFGCVVGFSDHTQGSVASIVAVGMGAAVIEKHFTLDRTLPGPDQSNSATPSELAALVQAIRDAELALGSPIKTPTNAELGNMASMRRSLVSQRPIRAGEIISEANLTLKRPAVGIAPRCWSQIIGWHAKVDIRENQPLQWWMVEPPDH
ncbi:N-acetylneuraminate synthase [Acidobacteria bacterium AH-259-O06]|nr:N-acetylneuraminate synthase [Acidobacteria bacterium AH-259-O06]